MVVMKDFNSAAIRHGFLIDDVSIILDLQGACGKYFLQNK